MDVLRDQAVGRSRGRAVSNIQSELDRQTAQQLPRNGDAVCGARLLFVGSDGKGVAASDDPFVVCHPPLTKGSEERDHRGCELSTKVRQLDAGLASRNGVRFDDARGPGVGVFLDEQRLKGERLDANVAPPGFQPLI